MQRRQNAGIVFVMTFLIDGQRHALKNTSIKRVPLVQSLVGMELTLQTSLE
jgi:hypothetical protein